MIKYLLIILLAMCCYTGYAQEKRPPSDERIMYRHNEEKAMGLGTPPFSYIGFSSGLNNPAGAIGFDFDIPVHRYLVLGVGGGFSSWGNKLHLDAKYFFRQHQRGWALGGGFTFNSGDNKFITRPLQTNAGIKEKVSLDLKVQRNVFFAVYHYWNLGRRYNRFFAGLGWSVPLVERKFIQLSGDNLTNKSAKRIDLFAPGGPMLSLGFSFGLHHR